MPDGITDDLQQRDRIIAALCDTALRTTPMLVDVVQACAVLPPDEREQGRGRREGYQAALVVPEAYYPVVNVNEKVNIQIPALGERSVEGVIGVVVPAADPQSRSFVVKVDIPRQEEVRAGMFVRAAIPTGEEALLLVPDTAVVQQGGLTGIYQVMPDQTARYRLVRTGRTFGDLLELISGLKPGDPFVVDPPPQMVDGARVEARP